MHIKAVIWDIGGVINRTEDLDPRDKLASELGVTRDRLNYLFFYGPEGTRAQNGEITTEELIAYVRLDLSLADDEIPDLLDRFFGGDIIDYPLVEFIRDLRPAYKTGIISNAWKGLPDILKKWGIEDAFDTVISSGDVGIMKPDPKIYSLALSALDIQPGEAVFIDDYTENIHGARSLGIHAIQFINRNQTLDELESLLGWDRR